MRQASPKTKVAGSGAGGVRSKISSRAQLSPTGEGVAARNGGKTGRGPTSGEREFVCVCERERGGVCERECLIVKELGKLYRLRV